LSFGSFLPKIPTKQNKKKYYHHTQLPRPLKNGTEIARLTLPSLAHFYAGFYSRGRPLVIEGLVSGLPAFQKWDWAFLAATCGHRTVPVEIGRRYTDEDWRQTLMPFADYLRDYVFPREKVLEI
jgi:lysine-specific demethylase 8